MEVLRRKEKKGKRLLLSNMAFQRGRSHRPPFSAARLLREQEMGAVVLLVSRRDTDNSAGQRTTVHKHRPRTVAPELASSPSPQAGLH